jgi:rRNA maturation endonuclease Nob1
MTWNFPITKTIKCHKCGKEFDMVLVDRNSEKHLCPHCGNVPTFDFDEFEKKAIEEAKAAFRKNFR